LRIFDPEVEPNLDYNDGRLSQVRFIMV